MKRDDLIEILSKLPPDADIVVMSVMDEILGEYAYTPDIIAEQNKCGEDYQASFSNYLRGKADKEVWVLR